MIHVAGAPELFDRTLWSHATGERRDALARGVAEELGPSFEYVGLRRYFGTQAAPPTIAPVAVFMHPAAGAFSLVPGGGFDMGLSPEEERTIRLAREADDDDDDDDFNQEFDLLLSEIERMRPMHRVVVPPYLIAQRVLSVAQAQRWLPDLRDPLYGDVPQAAAHLDAAQIAAVLAGTGLRLPSEAELEYAARGALDRRLLPWGDCLPDGATIEAMLIDSQGVTHNALGLHGYGLYPELCADHWHEHYRGAPTDGAPWLGAGMHVIRGGAADCYPWQGCGEWNLLLCALRMNELAAEYGSSLRLVRGLVEGFERTPSAVAPEPRPLSKKQPAATTRPAASKKRPLSKKRPAAKKKP